MDINEIDAQIRMPNFDFQRIFIRFFIPTKFQYYYIILNTLFINIILFSFDWLVDWFIDFNSILTRLKSLYAWRLGIVVRESCSYLHFCILIKFFLFCVFSTRIRIVFNRSIYPIDGTLTSTTTADQSGLERNGSKGTHFIPQFSKTGG